MIRVYCDRCKKQAKTDFVNVYEKAQEMQDGEYIGSINKVVNGEVHGEKYSKDVEHMDLCEKCNKELSELIVNFMKNK